MEKELKELKSVLRSIVVSSPAQVDVGSLQRDYRNIMGSAIPVTKYGYRDVLLFLKERCNDCFLFQGLASNPVLTLIVPDSLKHIDSFVRSQKPSAVTKIKGKRRSVNETAVVRQNLICESFNTRHVPTQRLHKTQSTVKALDIKKDVVPTTNIPTNSIYNSNKDLMENTKSKIETNFKVDNGYVNAYSEIVENGNHGNVRNFLKKRIPMYDSSHYLDTEACSEPDKVSSKDDDSGRQTSSSQSSTKKAQLEELKCEIHELIKEHEEGIWSTDLMRLYRERYNRELNFQRFGYHNINSLLCAMDERVSFTAEGGGVRLRDAARAPAAPAAAPAPTRARAGPRPAPRAQPVDPDDALPGIDFEADVFPADCLHFLESIPAQAPAELRPGAMLECAVAEVYSPSHFWLQRLGPGHSVAMDDLMDEMLEYYGTGAGRTRHLARGAVRPGHYCSSLYQRDWHRSLIVRVLDADTVKVRHVDYGTVDTVAVSSLKPLLRRWAALPAQAMRARLAGLRPAAAGRRWPHAAAVHFLQLVRDRRFVANVVAVDPEEDTIETFLIDTTGADDVCLTAEMIRSGYADARTDSALRVSASAPLDVRSLVDGIMRLGRREEATSDVSASASELVGAPALRICQWESSPPASPAPSASPVSPVSPASHASHASHASLVSPASPTCTVVTAAASSLSVASVSSKYLARMYALHKLAHRLAPTSTVAAARAAATDPAAAAAPSNVTADCYLYPRFDALESGDTPNFTEIHRYLADGISLEYVEAYRRHVPAALPAPSPPAPPAPPAAPSAARLPPPLELLNRIPLLRLESPPPTLPAPLRADLAPVPPPTSFATLAFRKDNVPSVAPVLSTGPAHPTSLTYPAMSAKTASIALAAAASLSMVKPISAATSVSATESLFATTSLSGTTSLSWASSLSSPRSLSAATSPSVTSSLPVPCAQHARHSVPPRWGGAAGPACRGEVRLSVQECELYALLSSVDPAAAHCYMLSALRRARTRSPHPCPRPPPDL